METLWRAEGLGLFWEGGQDRPLSVIVRQMELTDVSSAPRQPLVMSRTTPETKARFAALAASRGLTESALLTRLIDTVLEHNEAVPPAGTPVPTEPATDRISLRLRRGD